MENIKDKILKFLHLDNLIDNATGFVEARVQLLKLEIREEVARVLSKALAYFIIAFFGFLLLIFLSLGLAQFLNGYFEQPYFGYWTVAGVYGLIFVLLLIFRKDIDRKLERHFVEMIKRKDN